MRRSSKMLLAVGLIMAGLFASPPVLSADHHLVTFVAVLTGGGESPGVATGAFGDAVIVFDTNTRQADYTVRVYNMPTVTASHIHVGSAGTAGPVIYNFAPPVGDAGDLIFRGRIDLDRDLIPRPAQGVLTGRDVEQILGATDGQILYVNVHSTQNPSGEVRGQLTLQH